MKKFVIIASALAILATPAFAATAKSKHHHKAHAKVSQAESPAWGTGQTLPYQFDTQGKAHRIMTPQQPGIFQQQPGK